jgi:anthranilate/para-aminobenzoate synthase component I
MDGETMPGVEAAAIAEALLASGHPLDAVWPMWADGGRGAGGYFAPRRHVVAAWPARVEVPEPRALTGAGLVRWLREHLDAAERAGCLAVLPMSYDAGLAFDPATAHLVPAPEDGLPPLSLAVYPAWLERDGDGRWRLCGDPDSPAAAHLHAAVRRAEAGVGLGPPEHPPLTLAAAHPREVWEEGFREIRRGLERGDFYQVNLARHLEARIPRDLGGIALAALALRLMRALSKAQPAAFGAWVPLARDRWLVSGSPELLLGWDAATRTAITWPIKGTLPASADPGELARSSKDRAEHVMIVDLMRNDLGRVAVPGSVAVTALYAPLGLSTVHHLVSEVSARLRPELDLADLLAAIFPGGSVTGAPRIAAMQAIATLEPAPRRYYCGTLGLIRPGGAATFSLLIRTALVGTGTLRYPVGGGLVADSDMAREWDETEQKAAALRRALEYLWT